MRYEMTIDRFEGDKAVLKTEDNQTIIWPKNMLPENSVEGAVLSFSLSSDKNQEEDKRRQAKELLNELLNTEEK